MNSKEFMEEGKKVTCPKCGAEISYLISRENKVEEYILWRGEEGNIHYNKTDKYDSPTGNRFFCPKCRSKLSESREEAEKIIKGE